MQNARGSQRFNSGKSRACPGKSTSSVNDMDLGNSMSRNGEAAESEVFVNLKTLGFNEDTVVTLWNSFPCSYQRSSAHNKKSC